METRVKLALDVLIAVYQLYQSPVPAQRTVILNKQTETAILEPFLFDRVQIHDHLRDGDEQNMNSRRGHSPRCQKPRVRNALRNLVIRRCQAESERKRLKHKQIDVQIAPVGQIRQIPVRDQNRDHLNK
jgi:hypothetical protein